MVSDQSDARGQRAHSRRRRTTVIVVVLVAALAVAAVVWYRIQSDETRLRNDRVPRSLDCATVAGGRFKTPPIELEAFELAQNSTDYVEFRARFSSPPTQHAVPNKDVVNQPRTTLEIRMHKKSAVIPVENERVAPRSDDTYSLAFALEDRYDLTVYDEGNSPVIPPRNVSVEQRGDEVIVRIDPDEFPGLPAGKSFGLWAGAYYDFHTFGGPYNKVACR
ncbi:hypothetical protein [Nocardia farcinica]|uniref:hypothetical protein n=1 Tax=Nocardia farcinica TaxID=37329 RepID=UPI002455AABC|nr:hypothetical protein [Nocardia farcinica]